ncbi:MAG: diguanylate cyclase [Tardiphaga sp.]|nr:diguanylate cyclase [Tardiphaga sp.]
MPSHDVRVKETDDGDTRRDDGTGGRPCRGLAMLSVPTLWIVFIINFVSLGMVWIYVLRNYPSFTAARFWAAATILASVGAGISGLRGSVSPWLPIIIGNPILIFSCGLAAMGIRRFYNRPPQWRIHLAIVAVSAAGLAVFTVFDHMAARVTIASLASALILVLVLPLMFARIDGRRRPGAQLTGAIATLMVTVYVARSVGALLGLGGAISFTTFNSFQAVILLLIVFLSMAWNFGFMLMAIDRLHSEVAGLALLDDLTGVANRRHMVRRMTKECALAQQSGEPFSVLAIDLDGFKAINDRYGHAAGDECLRLFTRAAQSRLRPDDLLSRTGGDEFFIVLPATTQREAAMIARYVLESCRAQVLPFDGATLAVSIGVAQWHPAVGTDVERLIAVADKALYAAKSQGKNRYAIFDHAPRGLEPPMRQSA